MRVIPLTSILSHKGRGCLSPKRDAILSLEVRELFNTLQQLSWLELHQGPLFRHVIEDRFQKHIHLQVIQGALHDVGNHAGPFVQLNHGIDVGGILPKGGVGRLVDDGIGVEPAPAANLGPSRCPWINSWGIPPWDKRKTGRRFCSGASSARGVWPPPRKDG